MSAWVVDVIMECDSSHALPYSFASTVYSGSLHHSCSWLYSSASCSEDVNLGASNPHARRDQTDVRERPW